MTKPQSAEARQAASALAEAANLRVQGAHYTGRHTADGVPVVTVSATSVSAVHARPGRSARG